MDDKIKEFIECSEDTRFMSKYVCNLLGIKELDMFDAIQIRTLGRIFNGYTLSYEDEREHHAICTFVGSKKQTCSKSDILMFANNLRYAFPNCKIIDDHYTK